MADREEKDSRPALLGARLRSALGVVRRQGEVSLRGVHRSAADAADRLKHTQTAERLGAKVESWRIVKKAADAQQRGNHAMAYRLLEPEVRDNPDDPRVVAAFWSAALACDRAEDAVPAMVRVIRKLAGGDESKRAAELWIDLRSVSDTTLLDPTSLVRIAQALEADGASDQAIAALREAVDLRNASGLSPGLAVRIAEMSRDLDPRSALRAARSALASPDLHESKRARLEAMVVTLEHEEAEEAESDVSPPAESSGEDATVRAVDAALEALAPTARFSDIKITEAMPTGLLDEAIGLQVLGGRKVRVEYGKIEAVSVAEIWGLALHPVVVIDLLLNWSEGSDPTLRVVRLRSDGFDPRMVIAAPPDEDEALRSFLSELLGRSNAAPLPDPDSALGVKVRAFNELELYQREVLQVGA
jgi:tetratricopeptide (TPR) repeat protein